MNKRLLIVRHAKSDWDEPEMKDFDRPLNNRGHKNAPEMANRLLRKKLTPDLLVSSPALRAITTVKYFADAFGIPHHSILQKKEIYEASAATLLNMINCFDNNYQYVMLTGHNPGLTDLCVKLSVAYITDIPTCGMAMIGFPFDDWGLIRSGTGELLFFDYPKNTDHL